MNIKFIIFTQYYVKIILVGNKKDLRIFENDPSLNNVKMVSCEEGQILARKIGAYTYLECSVLYNDGVLEVFLTAVQAV